MLRISHRIGQFLSYLAVGNPLWSNTAPWKPFFSPRFYKAVFQEFQASHLWEKNELFKFHCCFIIFLARTQVGHVTCCYCILYLLNDAICWQKANQIGGKTGSIFRSFPHEPPFSWSNPSCLGIKRHVSVFLRRNFGYRPGTLCDMVQLEGLGSV